MEKEKRAQVLMMMVEVLIPEAHSLKEKRRVIKPCIEKLKKQYNTSVAEIGYLDKWQRAVVGLTMLSTDKLYLEKCMTQIEILFLETADMQLIKFDCQWL